MSGMQPAARKQTSDRPLGDAPDVTDVADHGRGTHVELDFARQFDELHVGIPSGYEPRDRRDGLAHPFNFPGRI